jgi:hypothetical protein
VAQKGKKEWKTTYKLFFHINKLDLDGISRHIFVR